MRDILKKLIELKLGFIGLVIIIILALLGALADFIAPYDPFKTNLSKALLPVSIEHIFGTDELGRDIFSRILYGARITLAIAVLSTGLGAIVGIPIGILSGYYGGKLDLVVQRFIDIMLSIPGIILALALVAVLGTGMKNIVISVGIYFIPIYVRIARGSTLQIRDMDYILIAKQLGLSEIYIMFKHILPNISAPLIAQTTLNMGIAILFASGLGFLGLGVPPPAPEWGTMLGTGKEYIFYDPYPTLFPGLFIFLSVLAFNLLGDTLQEILARRYI